LKLPISEIIVGERRREEMGDIQRLAESIQQFTLLHPIVVDEQKNLVAGGRRLMACKSLGWREIEATFLGELSDKQRQEIELEENLRRKDLTEIEKSRNMVKLAEIKAEQLRETFPSLGDEKVEHRPNEQLKTMPTLGIVSGTRGPEKRVDSTRTVAQEMGIPRQTLMDAQQHVQAVDKYPTLETLPKKEAISTAKQLDNLPPEERSEAIENEEFQRAYRIKERMRRLIERLHLFSQHPAETYFEGMDKVELMFEEAFWWNSLNVIDGAMEFLTDFRSEYAKRFGGQQGARKKAFKITLCKNPNKEAAKQ